MAIVLLLLLAIAFVFISWKLLQRPNLQHHLPPSPPALPIIGHGHYFLRDKTPSHHILFHFSQSYGPLISIRLGNIPVIVASSAALAREFLRTHDQAFASRPSTLATKLVTYNSGNLVSAPYGDPWRTMKKVLTSDLLASKRLEGSNKKVREEEVSLLMARFFRASQTGEQVDIKHFVTEFVFNTITRMMMNKTYYGPNSGDGDQANQFTALQAKIIKLVAELTIGDCFPCLKWLDFYTARYMKGIHRLQDEFLEKIVDEHRMSGGKAPERDFVDVLLSHADRGQLTTTNIKALLQDLIIAATDTSTVTIELAFAELLLHPEVMRKAKDELNTVVGRGQVVKESHLPKLSYLYKIVMETLRLHPPVPLPIHQSIAPCKVQGYEFPAGTRLFVNLYAIGRDPSTWDSPSEFLPERFETTQKIEEYTRDFHLIPFGVGRRACPGASLGLTAAQLVLASMLHMFDWLAGTKEIDMREVHGLVTSLATPLKAIPRPVHPSNVPILHTYM